MSLSPRRSPSIHDDQNSRYNEKVDAFREIYGVDPSAAEDLFTRHKMTLEAMLNHFMRLATEECLKSEPGCALSRAQGRARLCKQLLDIPGAIRDLEQAE